MSRDAAGSQREHRVSLALAHAIYDTLAACAVWLALVPFMTVQLARGRVTRRHLQEWLGHIDLPAPRGLRVIVHAVSAGEAAAAGRFIETLVRARPTWSVVFTCGNRDARTVAAALQQRLPAIEHVIYLPWDRRRATRRWLSQIAPSAVVVVQPEIWPNLYRACGDTGVPLLLIEANIYSRDVARYRLARGFLRSVLRVPRWIGAVSADAREALIAIGAPADRIDVVGSLKFDAAADVSHELADLVAASRDSQTLILIGGSTHASEDALLIDALARLRSRRAGLRLILAPRHIARSDSIMDVARNRDLTAVRGSELDRHVGPWDVLVVDRLGDLATLYREADVALVGGTLVQRGGHNVLEPASFGTAIIVGPHTNHIAETVAGLTHAGGIVCLPDAGLDTLSEAIARLLDDESHRQAIGSLGQAYQRSRAGTARRAVQVVIDAVEGDDETRGEVRSNDRPRERSATWPLDASEAES